MNHFAKSSLLLLVVVMFSGCEKQDPTALNAFSAKLERSLETPVRVSCKDGWVREIPLRSVLQQQLECDANLRCEGVAMIGPDHTLPLFMFSAQVGPRNNTGQQRNAAIGVVLVFDETVPVARGYIIAKTVAELDANKIDVTTLKKPVFDGTK